MKFLISFLLICSVKAQNQIQLQFIGDSLTLPEATERDLCKTKYCLLDASYLFTGATQNKSVRPCEDFQEFAVGTFAKYQSVSDRYGKVGFLSDLDKLTAERRRKSLAAPITERDTRITKGMKQIFAKCVNSNYVNVNGVRDIREYARSFGFRFYPETDQSEFNLTKYIELQPARALSSLFSVELIRDGTENLTLTPVHANRRNNFYIPAYHVHSEKKLLQFYYETMLYDMNKVFRNASYADEYKREFMEIATKQIEFYKMLEASAAGIRDETKILTIDELNNLTSSLNVNWLNVINNMLTTKVESDQLVQIYYPKTMTKFAEYLSSLDVKSIASFLVYDFLFDQTEKFIVYPTDWKLEKIESNKPFERWQQCLAMFISSMHPALDFVYMQRFRDEKLEESIRSFARETINFGLKKFEAEGQRWGKEVFEDVSERLRSIKIWLGYMNIDDAKLEELYGDLKFGDELNYAEITDNIIIKNKKFGIKPNSTSRETQKIIDLASINYHGIKFIPDDDNILYIRSQYLMYPFYHYQRPRFFNTATVSNLIFRGLHFGLRDYLENKYNVKDFNVFAEHTQVAFEFYEDWLESGGIDLNLGANRMTNQQLYWIAAARFKFIKRQNVLDAKLSNDFHKLFVKFPGFVKAFDCEKQEQKS